MKPVAKSTEFMHHSHQGSQYITSEDFQRLMADQGIACSMRREGRLLGQRGDRELLLDAKD